jgi:uncharacterized LabA/DUF88 family protein
MKRKYAILVDGGFITKRIAFNRKPRTKSPATIQEVTTEFNRIKNHESVKDLDLLRIYFYDAPPATGKLKNPISGTELDLAAHPNFSANQSLQQSLEMQTDVALRSGEISVQGWEIGGNALKDISKNGTRALTERDFIPNIQQKGVDLRIGLDIARLSLRQLVDIIVVVTGDSDMVPAFKFARREGIRVYLDHMGHAVKRDLMVHVDRIISRS